MKLTQIKSHKRKAGMTLLELTVVILVLLSLISILFVGARAWKKGSDRAGCILNIRNVQQAVRGYQNMNQEKAGITEAVLYGTAAVGSDPATQGYLRKPTCPSDKSDYTASFAAFPAVGFLAITCTNATKLEHAPAAAVMADW